MRILPGLIALLFFTSHSLIYSQVLEITIDSDDIEQCEGVLLDTGGNATGALEENENHSITWCAQNPETVLNLYWAIFDLRENSTLTIYDGDSNDAPLIGSYSGTELQSLNITSSNPTGCLTVEFVSVASGSNFGALVSCGEPCEAPMAHAYWDSENQLPYVDGHFRACIGDSLTLYSDSSTSVGEDNPIVSWEWDMGNATYTGESSITHVYDNPGLYSIDLIIEDSNDCQNQNTIDFSVLVSTDATPIITSDFQICLEDTAEISGMIEGVPYIAEPSNDFGDGLYIPDDQTQCFYSELTFTSFTPGSVIEDATVDIESFFVNMEHSYMGDLTIMLECPNGQSIYVHQQGGAGTYLGEPIDNNSDEIPGIGYDYSWEPLLTNGTWADNSGVGTLPAGSYASEQPFSNLDGCPLNGTWQIEVCDLFGIDNGFIFGWGIQFDPELYPEAISFTPEFNLEDCESTYWYTENNEFILEESQNDGDCSTVDINPTITGPVSFMFHTTNNFGCHYEDTLNVEVQGVDVLLTASPRQFCGQPLPIIANVVGYGVSLEDCDFTWSTTTEYLELVPYADFPVSDTAAFINEMEDPTTFTLDVLYNIPGSSEACINSHSLDIETCGITIPNVFSPNGDNINDEWYVSGLGSFVGSEVYIYDRWGVEVHYYKIGNNGVNPRWNGEVQNPVFKDVTVAAGVYYYVVKVYLSGEEELFVVDQNCPCEDGGFDIDCCQDDTMINQDEWTTYTGILTINR